MFKRIGDFFVNMFKAILGLFGIEKNSFKAIIVCLLISAGFSIAFVKADFIMMASFAVSLLCASLAEGLTKTSGFEFFLDIAFYFASYIWLTPWLIQWLPANIALSIYQTTWLTIFVNTILPIIFAALISTKAANIPIFK